MPPACQHVSSVRWLTLPFIASSDGTSLEGDRTPHWCSPNPGKTLARILDPGPAAAPKSRSGFGDNPRIVNPSCYPPGRPTTPGERPPLAPALLGTPSTLHKLRSLEPRHSNPATWVQQESAWTNPSICPPPQIRSQGGEDNPWDTHPAGKATPASGPRWATTSLPFTHSWIDGHSIEGHDAWCLSSIKAFFCWT